MNYVKGQRYTFPVSEVMLKPLWGKLYYNILANGEYVRVAAMEFQRDNKPSELQVICTSDDPSNLKFEQDRASLIPEIYKEGETYEFKIISDSPINGAYRLQDANGWPFRLEYRSREKLNRYSVVKCVVKKISGTDLELELVQENKKTRTPFVTLEMLEGYDTMRHLAPGVLSRLMHTSSAFGDAMEEYKQGNPMWVIFAIDAARVSMPEWMSLNPANAIALLKSVRTIALALLQTAGFIDTFNIKSRDEYRQALTRFVLYTDDYIQAIELVEAGREQQYIDDTLSLIQNASYIFRPEERMHVLMAIFTIRTAYVSAYIHQIFKIIKERHSTGTFMALFRKPFVEMLDIYISNAGTFVLSDSKASVKDMVEALALQLLLTDNDEYAKWGIYRARLYRYSSMLLGKDSADMLLRRAYSMLLSPDNDDLGISWNDLDNIPVTALGMVHKMIRRPAGDSWFIYEGHNATLTLDDDNITLKPSVKSAAKWIPALPAQVLPDFKLQVYLNERMKEKPGSIGRSIAKAQRLWAEIEESLFSTVHAAPVVVREEVQQKSLPSPGQIIPIRITSKELVEREGEKPEQIFNATIESPEYEGSGFVRRENIVRYPVRIEQSHFVDGEGRPYLFNATVLSVQPDGKIEFTLRPIINVASSRIAHDYRTRHIQDPSYASDEADCYAVVTGGEESFSKGYLCVSSEGVPFNIPKRDLKETLAKGDRIIARIYYVKYNSQNENLYVNAEFRAFEDEAPFDITGLSIELSEALKVLIEAASEGNYYVEPETDSDAETPDSGKTAEYLDPDYLREIIAILSERAAVYTDYFQSYNCLALTRLMALMAGERETALTLARRMELIQAIDNFDNNGRPDTAVIGTLFEQCRKLREKDSDINIKLHILSILSALDRPATDQINIPSPTLDDGRLNKMARMAIAYNSLLGMEYDEEQFHLRQGLYKLAGLEFNSRDHAASVTVADGEDQTTEFKSSLIYPADNRMQPDEKKQVTEIMQVVCGFLNSRTGGTLFIGADNFGQPIGLERDFTYLNGRNHNFDMQLMRDKFELLFRNGFYDHFGVTPGGYNLSADFVSTSFEEYGKATVYVVKIGSAPEAVTMTDGSIFVRQGTSTRPIVGEENQAKFRATRSKQR